MNIYNILGNTIKITTTIEKELAADCLKEKLKKKNRKSPVLDNLRNELFKYNTEELITPLQTIPERPTSRKQSIKRDKKNPQNYRWIAFIKFFNETLPVSSKSHNSLAHQIN